MARIVAGLQLQDQAQIMRLNEFQNAATIITRYPVFGVGFGQAGELDLTTGVSSVYLTVAERTGLVGLAAFVVVMVAFFVLLAPDVPAVLIETGFLSNRGDERRLNDPLRRQAVAGAIADAVDSYFEAPRLYAGA